MRICTCHLQGDAGNLCWSRGNEAGGLNPFLQQGEHFTGRDSALLGEVNVTSAVLQEAQTSVRLCQELYKHTWEAAVPQSTQ